MSQVMIRNDEGSVAQQPAWGRIARFLTKIANSIHVRRADRALHLCESLPLGEKRFLAVVQVEEQRFLIGVAHQSISLLRQLDCKREATAGVPRKAEKRNCEDRCN